MKVVVVGAGPMGRVLGFYLGQGGADVRWLVKPSHVAALRGGFAIRSWWGRPRSVVPALITEPEPADLVVVATSAVDLRDWGRWGHVVALQPVLDPIPGVTRGLFTVAAQGAGATDPEPVRMLRLGRLPFAGPRAAEVAGLLAAGGLPTRVVDDVLPELVASAIVLDPLAAGIGAAGGLRELARDGAIRALVVAAHAECAAAVGRSRVPMGAVIAAAARAPFGLRAYLDRHYGKLTVQTAAALADWLGRGAGPAVAALRERLDRPGPSLAPGAARRLADRPVLAVRDGGPAVKRNVHVAELSVPATAFRAALEEELAAPGQRFGALVVKRPADRVGRPFEVGDRFTGCLSPWPGAVAPRWVQWVEDRLLSDYAVIDALTDDAVTYRYLQGSPIAGASTYRVEATGAESCRFEAVFECQEVGLIAMAVLHGYAHRKHDEVVAEQVRRAAARAGGQVTSTTLPPSR